MKSVVKCCVLFFAVLLCMGMAELCAMKKSGERVEKDQFAATKVVLGMACEYVKEIPTNVLNVLKAKFPHLTNKQLIISLVTICLGIGVEEFMRVCVMSNGDWLTFLSMTNVQDIFFGAANHT